MNVMKQYEVLASNPIVSYKVWLANQNNECISQARTYYVDRRYRRTERHVLFSNSLGGYDTLRLVGQSSQALKATRTSAERERPAGAGIDFSSLYVVDVAGERTITLQTGWLERNARATLRYMDELLLAREWYLITEKGHQVLQLQTTDLVGDEGNDRLISRSFTFQVATDERHYSELPKAPVVPLRPTGWRGVGFRQILDAQGKRTGMGAVLQLRKYYLDNNADVKPVTQKPNTQGDPDYIAPTPIPGVVAGSTPFPSPAISRLGSYKRASCPSGQEGGAATINVPAGKYGGESLDDSTALADADAKAQDTQAYADANGSCSLSENYTWNVPAGQWHIRFSHPAGTAIWHNDGQNGLADMGNTQSLQNQSGQFVYPAGSNDLNFPVGDANWLLYSLGTPYVNKRITIYKNGVPLSTSDYAHNRDGYEQLALIQVGGGGVAPKQGDLFYVKIQDR
jgi:hypothetical protein